jgi:assimilatory nitrate reductase catalytic subunit
LLVPSERPPVTTCVRGKIVCNCFDVAEADIARVLAGITSGEPLARLQTELRCGTNCGSCVPEIKQQIARARAEPLEPSAV